MPPPAELQNRPQDGISWIQKVTAVELGFWLLSDLSGYVGIYRRKEYVNGETGGPRGRGARPGGAPSTLVTVSGTSWSRVQVSRITFGEKITFPKVSFHLESV